jgi:putative aminopeptidase FrvX
MSANAASGERDETDNTEGPGREAGGAGPERAAPGPRPDGQRSEGQRRLLALLDRLCVAHAPPGSEDEVDDVVCRHLEGLARRVWRDAAGNVVAHIPGRDGPPPGGPLLLNAHKDEIALMVKRVEEDGRMRVRPIGGAHPWKWGEGPVDLLADDGTMVPAALCFGPSHISSETPLRRVKDGQQGLTWEMTYVDAKLSRSDLARRGVHAGTKVVLERARKRPRQLGDFVCAHVLDDRGGVAILLEVAGALHQAPAPQDIYLVFSSMEEINGGSVLYAADHLGAGAMVGLEIVPAAAEYGVVNDARPVLVHGDVSAVYDAGLTRRLATLAEQMEIKVQHAVLSSFGSDPGAARRSGAVPRAALLGFATDNTHGYEIAHLQAMADCARLVEALVRHPAGDAPLTSDRPA